MNVKKCTRCLIIKLISDFSKASREKDGLQPRCKACNKIVSAEYRAKNVEKERERHAKYHAENKNIINARVLEWQKNNSKKRKAIVKKFYQNHKESEKLRHAKWVKNNPNRKKENTKAWRLKNIEYARAYDSWYAKENKAKVNAKNAKRRAILLKATPLWANFEKITQIYAESIKISQQTGIEHHVDHVIPLKSKLVCGLHCETNLKILEGGENLRKNNKFVPF
jgi:hypothetical protein